MKVDIRSESENDYADIAGVNNLAFGTLYESALVEKLRKNPLFIKELSLVASVENKIVGHILFFPIQVQDDKNTYTSLALAPMSVLPEFQKKGIGSILIKAGLDQAKKKGFDSVIVLGHPNYYPRFGFEPAKKYNITPPKEEWRADYFALELTPGSLQPISGKVKYPSEFD